MKHSYALSTWTLLVAILLTIIITTLANNIIVFALYWLGILGVLIALLNKKVWKASEWLAFATFSASTMIGVLLATSIVFDRIGLGVTILGLLLVTSVVNAIHEKPVRIKRSTMVISTRTGKKFHRPACPLIAKSKNPISYGSIEQAQYSGKIPCDRCF